MRNPAVRREAGIEYTGTLLINAHFTEHTCSIQAPGPRHRKMDVRRWFCICFQHIMAAGFRVTWVPDREEGWRS